MSGVGGDCFFACRDRPDLLLLMRFLGVSFLAHLFNRLVEVGDGLAGQMCFIFPMSVGILKKNIAK